MMATLDPDHSLKVESKMSNMSKPLELLDLPLDVLKAILKEVTHTNDLSALALSCSTINDLVSPLIYSRFDIVWPDGSSPTEPRMGVDALTFGLATLVMRQDLFEGDRNNSGVSEEIDSNVPSHSLQSPVKRRIRRGNNYSHFVRKFSLGNGPADLVQEYVITKDSGKLLGTMVALAIARMPNLECFTWDMPTGILRDIWIALSERSQPSKLDQVAIRFHDNRRAYEESGLIRSSNGRTRPVHQGQLPISNSDFAVKGLQAKFAYSNYHVESPNFSILPALSSISAINIDELANLDELSLLIAKSAHKLRELRVGIATTLLSSGLPLDSRAFQYLSPITGSTGILCLLFSGLSQVKSSDRLSDHHAKGPASSQPLSEKAQLIGSVDGSATSYPTIEQPDAVSSEAVLKAAQTLSYSSANDQMRSPPNLSTNQTQELAATSVEEAPSTYHNINEDDTFIDPTLKPTRSMDDENQLSGTSPSTPAFDVGRSDEHLINEHTDSRPHVVDLPLRIRSPIPQKLQLTRLELERQFLSVGLLLKAIEFPVLEHLTLLKCCHSEDLWQALKDRFAPTTCCSPLSASSPRPFETDANGTQSRLRRTPTFSKPSATPVYGLKLKRIYTDTVSSQLIAFMKETLAPNSLDWLLLQNNRGYQSTVTINQICKGPLRRHRGSLTKLLIDSSDASDKARARSVAAKDWTMPRELLSSLLSKAPKIRELSISLHYKDLHWFHQQLPNIQTLRSLHIPVVIDHISVLNGGTMDERDVALNIVDVVNLRRECELAYLAIKNKCFELVETKVSKNGRRRDAAATGPANDDDDSSDDDYAPHNHQHSSEDDDDDEDGDDNDWGPSMAAEAVDDGDEEAESSEDEADTVQSTNAKTKISLREILFFDDRVTIFKARHAKL